MKKRICLLLLVLLVLLVPHAASANSAPRNPWEITIYVEDVPEGTALTVHLIKGDGTDRALPTEFVTDGRNDRVWALFEEGDEQLCLVCTAPDGTETRSNDAAIVPYGKYVYHGGGNRLEEKTSYFNTKSNCETGSMILLVILYVFLIPVAVTLLVEWLTALCFRICPVKYVLAINAITNPVLNIMLQITASMLLLNAASYWVVLGLLEIAVVLIEFWFYTRKYTEIKRSRLLLFSVTANVLSLVIGGVVYYLIA